MGWRSPHPTCCPHSLQAEVAWLIRAVNPEVPLGTAAVNLIVEEVRSARQGSHP